ncbi:lantibiotic dehydratase family protein [Tenacibaculum sp.]|nr:lantibiotic dehydratase family protein [Tenacibaculum sp.]
MGTKKKSENQYKVLNRYCVRTPLFSFSNYFQLINSPSLTEIDFKKILKNVIFREAIYLASPELYNQIVRWENGKLKDDNKVSKLQISILKYFTRISTRCTPFGLFASTAVGKFDKDTKINIDKIRNYKRFTRFDTTFLTSLFQELLKDKDFRRHILFYPNTSIYKIGNHYRYVEYKIENKQRIYSLEGIKYSEYINLVLREASKGKSILELAFFLVSDSITEEEAKSFIEELIENQVLISELEVTLTGSDYFDNLIKRIDKIAELKGLKKELLDLQRKMIFLDAKLGNRIEDYEELVDASKKLLPLSEVKYLFQTDCFTNSFTNTLSFNVKKKLEKIILLFNRMTLPTASLNIEVFKREFTKRFGQSEVSLNDALDSEMGVGFGTKKEGNSSLLDDLPLVLIKKRYERIVWTDVDTILQKRLIQSIENKSYTIKLKEEEFIGLPLNWDNLPDTFSSIIEVIKEKESEKVFIKGAGGASAVNLLGRFCYGDEQLLDYTKEIAKLEEIINKEQVLAEIIHLPEARTGNILQRPILRKYEIPFLGKSSVSIDDQIQLEDILVSVKNDKIILRSKKLNKEILPRLGNAHNYEANPLPIYHFLCELQTQSLRSNVCFSWNPVLEKNSFLPRVEYDDVIISKARWSLDTLEFKKIFEGKRRSLEIEKWQKNKQIPNLIELVEGDNKLLINLKNENSISMLLDVVKNKKEFILEEFLFSNNEIVKGENENSYCNQFVVSFCNNKIIPTYEN